MEKYLESKGWTFKFKNGEFCLQTCPLCNAGPEHFYINQQKETFYCHKCHERGHILSLKKRLGDLPAIAHVSEFSKKTPTQKTIDTSEVEKYHKALLDNSAVLSYLNQERGINTDTVKKFKLGFNTGTGSITIPHFHCGACLNIKSRSLNSEVKKYFRADGCASVLFNLDAVRDAGYIILTEGEFDAIAYDQMGFPNVVAVTGGADTFLDEWIDPLEPYKEIFISYDMDQAGRSGAEKVADKLGRHRCKNVLLPLKDANDCLKAGYSRLEMQDFLCKAKPFELKLIKSPESYFDQIRELRDSNVRRGIETGWKNIDNLLGGIRPHELTVITGETGSGKTTLAANIGFNHVQNSHPVLVASFEMKPVTVLRKMVQMQTGSPLTELGKEKLDAALNEISDLPLYFVDAYGEIGLEELKGAIYYARRRYGIEMAILDHLHFFLKFSADHERQAIDQATRDIKAWTMELGIHILLIVHPTKLTYDNKVVQMNDLKGSSGLKQIPDNVLSIWRPRGEDDSKSPTGEIVLHVLKCRDDSGDEGKVILKFNKRSQSYSDSGPEGATSVERRGNSGSFSSKSRTPAGRDWMNGYDQR